MKAVSSSTLAPFWYGEELTVFFTQTLSADGEVQVEVAVQYRRNIPTEELSIRCRAGQPWRLCISAKPELGYGEILLAEFDTLEQAKRYALNVLRQCSPYDLMVYQAEQHSKASG